MPPKAVRTGQSPARGARAAPSPARRRGTKPVAKRSAASAAAPTPPAPKRSDSIGALLPDYNSLKYHAWQCRLLMFSSACFLSTGLVGLLLRGQPIFGGLVSCSGIASLNYWRWPGPGVRRDIDYVCAVLALGYAVAAGFGVRGLANTMAWAFFLAMFFLFRRSWVLSVGDGGDGSWASWHAAAHVSSAIAGAFQAFGDIDGWRDDIGRLSVTGNPLATASVGVLLAVVSIDALLRRAAQKRSSDIISPTGVPLPVGLTPQQSDACES